MHDCVVVFSWNKTQIHAWIDQIESEHVEAREASAVEEEIVKVYDIVSAGKTVHCILVDVDGEFQEIHVPYPIYEEGDVVRCYEGTSGYELIDN